MILAAHQPNLMPWFPYFEKMAACDVFVIQINCQFEKNGFQNRCMVNGKWWTNPVRGGTALIREKLYTDGKYLCDINWKLIKVFAEFLGIDTNKIVVDIPSEHRDPTMKLIELCKLYGCDEYLTNPDATQKYLDGELMEKNSIKIIPFKSEFKFHLFEMFDKFGIEKTKEFIRRRCKR